MNPEGQTESPILLPNLPSNKAPLFSESLSDTMMPEEAEDSLATESIADPVDTVVRTVDQLEKARKRQESYLKSRRQEKKRRALLQRVRAILKVFGSLALITGLYYLVTASFWTFDARNVTVEGNQLLKPAQITSYLKALDGQALYRINAQSLSQQLQRNIPLLEQVWIRRALFPTALRITVAEKPFWAAVYTAPPLMPKPQLNPKTDASTDIKPVTQEAVSSESRSTLPQYLVHWDKSLSDLSQLEINPSDWQLPDSSVALVASEQQIQTSKMFRYQKVALFLAQYPRQARLLYLDICQPDDVYAVFEGFKVRIGAVQGDTTQKLAPLFAMLPAIRERAQTLDYVDFRWQNQIVLKLRSGQAQPVKPGAL